MSCSCKIGGGPDGVCFECKSRRAFHARLAKLEEAKASEDYARGVADERARVVADLRRKANIISALSKAFAVSTARALRDRADHYERGGHESESVTTAAVKSDDRCPFPGCNGVKDHVECPTCGQEHCDRCFS